MIIKEKIKTLKLAYQVNALIKAKFQERKSAAELARYRQQAQRKKITIPDRGRLACLLRERLRKRGVSPQPKRKGNLHIFLAYSLTNWETVLPRALKAFDKVTEFEWRSRGFNDTAGDWLAQRERINEDMLAAFYKAQTEMPVDAVVGYVTNYSTNPSTLQKMGESGAVIFNFCWDGSLYFSLLAELVSVVDLNLTNAAYSLVKYAAEGGLSIFWPEAAHPEVHRPYDVPFEYEVSFVGKKYGWRPRFIEFLRRNGIDIVACGYGWDNGSLSEEETVKLYSKSRVNLGFAGIGYSRKLMCLKGRDFEIPMSGGLYLTQDNPQLSMVYDVGKEILTYKNEKDCLDKIKWILNNPGEAQRIREAGRARALKDHTWEKRFEEIFKIAGILI